MTMPKKIFYASMIFAVLVSAGMIAFYFAYHRPRIKHYERVGTFLDRVEEHADVQFELKLLQSQFEADGKLLEIYNDELTYREDMSLLFPEIDMSAYITDYRMERDAQALKLADLEKKLDLTSQYLSMLEEYILLTCFDFKLSDQESQKIMKHELSRAEIVQLLIDRGILK
ncbi:MAG: hypothetical protein Kow00107_01300 [Planctomycetota bacterium]